MKGDWRRRALQGAGIGIIVWWFIETLKQLMGWFN